MLDGNVDAWEDYCKLQKEVESLVRKKNIDMWNNVVGKIKGGRTWILRCCKGMCTSGLRG